MKSPSAFWGDQDTPGLPSSEWPRNKTLHAIPATVCFDYTSAAKRTFGEPTMPLFCIAAFMASEPNQERAFATSATSCRTTISF